jgi:thiamine kinase-like enzyme
MVVEYIETIKLTPLLAAEPNVMREIAMSRARFHSMDLLLDKRGFNVLKKTQEFIEKVPLSQSNSHWNEIKDSVKDKIDNVQDVEVFLDWDIIKELEWALLLRDKIKSRIVMSHGDSNFMNLLVRKTDVEVEL